MKCEKCNLQHDGKYGSGRFCSNKCARSFSSGDAKKKEERNKKISQSLLGHSVSEETKKKISQKAKILAGHGKQAEALKKYHDERRKKLPFERLTKNWQKEFLLEENGRKCDKCGQEENWNGKFLVLQLHHIDGNEKNKTRKNLEILCPNCHTQTDNYCNKNFPTDKWKIICKKGWETRKKKTESSSIG